MNINTIKNVIIFLMHQYCTNYFQFENFRGISEPFSFNMKPVGANLVLYYYDIYYILLYINIIQLLT